MTEDLSLPQPERAIRSTYTEHGEELAEYTGTDLGNQPEWDKRELIGQGLIIRGISTSFLPQPEGSSMPPARNVLYNLINEPRDVDPCGMPFTDKTSDAQLREGKEHPETAPVLKQIRSEFRKNGGRPLPITLDFVETSPATKNAAARGYYTIKRYVKNVTPQGDNQ